MEIRPVAFVRSPFKEKFGAPRQSGRAPHVISEIVFEPEYRAEEAFRGLEGFGYLWVLFGFLLSKCSTESMQTVSHAAC